MYSRTHTVLGQCIGLAAEAQSIIGDQSSSISILAIYDSMPPTGGHALRIGDLKTGREGQIAVNRRIRSIPQYSRRNEPFIAEMSFMPLRKAGSLGADLAEENLHLGRRLSFEIIFLG
tara:strand:+ start:199 stop:552 length:354 start_codon:yes stop_codon:yes gene_type:complete